MTTIRDMESNMSKQINIFISIFFLELGQLIHLVLALITKYVFRINRISNEENRKDYVPIIDVAQQFYFRYFFIRGIDSLETPLCSRPGALIIAKEREKLSSFKRPTLTGRKVQCINLSSYNYLGFADDETSNNVIENVLRNNSVSMGSSRKEFGTTNYHREVELLTAKFLGTEDAICFGMGFATNAQNLPAIINKDTLVLSDELNHASIINGLKLSAGCIKVFKHNDMDDLDTILSNSIVDVGVKWKKIIIVTEGIFSMEGTITKLPELVRIKKKYKAYLYVDEAHSIGALGSHGRGVCDYFKISPKEIDILMGTFTKAFAASGGYICGSKKFIDHLRVHSHAHCYAAPLAPTVAQKIICSMNILMDPNDGPHRFKKLQENSRYFRQQLRKMNLKVLGHDESPVIPVFTYSISKALACYRMLIQRGVAIAIATMPVVYESRIRFCISSMHTRQQLNCALEAIEYCAEQCGIKW